MAVVAARDYLTQDPPAYNGVFCDQQSDKACSDVQYPMSRTAEEELARKHSPILFLPRITACDSQGSAFRPIPVDLVLGNSEVALRKLDDPGFVMYGPTAADLFTQGSAPYFNAYVDLPGNAMRPGCRYALDDLRFSKDQPNVTYARVIKQDATVVVQYWLFYYFNFWNNKHEGDWEMIQLTFDAATAREALTQDPASIALSQHGTGEVANWGDGKVHREDGHPQVFVAAGSHSNYFAPRVFMGRGEDRTGFGCDDASGSVDRTPLQVVLLPANVSDPESPFAWLGFKGFWGEQGAPEFGGPPSPTTQQSWLKPLAWEGRLRSFSQIVPVGASMGPNAVRAYCDVVAFGSNSLLPWYREQPRLLLAVFGLFSLGMVASLTRTRYAPIVLLPLRSRRRIGQLLVSSLRLYRYKAPVFMALALVALPVGIIAPSAPWPGVTTVPLPDWLIARPQLDAFLQTMAHVELRLGLVHLLLVSAVTSAIACLDRGEDVGLTDSLVELVRRLPQLLIARLAAIAALLALSLTIVGIPFAIWLAVRWAFIEQAVLLEGKSGLEALRESARAVDRDWWWSAGTTLSLGLMALFVSAAVGIGVILSFDPMPLPYVNLLTSLVYVVTVPYVAIALSLAYFDLKMRNS